MTPAANFKSTSGAEEGGVPTRALKLSDDYMYDGWGRRFRYAVDPTVTKSAALPATQSCTSPVTPDASAITVNDATGATRTTAGAYALISHGANGHGAYTSNGVTLNAGGTSANELTNCHCTSTGAYSGTYTPTYVEKVPQYDSGQAGNALYFFDDIVTFKEGWQMQAQNYPLTAVSGCTQYLYITDQNNNNIQKFSMSGSYIATIATSGTGNGQLSSPEGIAMDSSGNLWVADYQNWRVQKLTSSGGFLLKEGSGANTYGKDHYWEPMGLTVESNNNVWVTDQANVWMQQINSSGSWLQSIGGPSPYTCETSPNTSGAACATGSSNGEFGGSSPLTSPSTAAAMSGRLMLTITGCRSSASAAPHRHGWGRLAALPAPVTLQPASAPALLLAPAALAAAKVK
jgi:hypothetical protein